MKKLWISLVLLSVFGGAMLLFMFTEAGNRWMIPFINRSLTHNVQGTKVELTHLRIYPSSLTAVAKVNDTFEVQLQGPVVWWEKQFDLTYSIGAKHLKTGETFIEKPVHIQGRIHGSMDSMKVSGEGEAFTSPIIYTLDIVDDKPQNIRLSVHDANLKEILMMVGEKPYAKGKLSADVDMPTFESGSVVETVPNLAGKISIKSQGEVDTKVVKNIFDINLGKRFAFDGSLVGEFREHNMIAKSIWKTDMGILKFSDLHYDINEAVLTGVYHLDIPELGKLEPLTQKRFRGDMVFDGKLVQKEKLTITGHGEEFGGTVDFVLEDQMLNAHAKGVTVSKIMYMFVYPQVIEALSEATMVYNLSTGIGSMDATLDHARILPNHLTRLIKEFLDYDLAKEQYNNSKFLAQMSPEKIDFSLDASNKNSYIRIPQGVLYKQSEKIDMHVDINIDGKDLQATVTGTLDKPVVKLDTSKFLKQKINKNIGKLLGNDKKDPSKDTGTKNIKGLLKGVF